MLIESLVTLSDAQDLSALNQAATLGACNWYGAQVVRSTNQWRTSTEALTSGRDMGPGTQLLLHCTVDTPFDGDESTYLQVCAWTNVTFDFPSASAAIVGQSALIDIDYLATAGKSFYVPIHPIDRDVAPYGTEAFELGFGYYEAGQFLGAGYWCQGGDLSAGALTTRLVLAASTYVPVYPASTDS